MKSGTRLSPVFDVPEVGNFALQMRVGGADVVAADCITMYACGGYLLIPKGTHSAELSGLGG